MSRSQSSSRSIGYSSDNCHCHCNGSFAESWNYCPYCGRPINVGISRGSTAPSCGTTGISFGQGRSESGWTKDITTSTSWDSDNTSHS